MKRRRVAVLGAGVAGLSAAIHLALDGHDVSVYEQRDVPGGKAAPIVQGLYRLDPGPSIIILTQIYEDLFRRAGVSDYLRLRRLDPWSRIFQEGREEAIDLPADREACLQVLSEAEPGDARGLRKLFKAIEKAAPEI
ncbi:MAG: FAD-dependent oxidoreductase, partial [Fimbriimonadaceae bacterium]|nr:FAD-dependent oxidoreductase [Fimbriimonadaceae bacterium]